MFIFFLWISTLHGRCQLLEEERLTITAQLAAKKEEVLSLGRDLIAQKDFVAILDAKLVQREIEATAFKESLMQLEVRIIANFVSKNKLTNSFRSRRSSELAARSAKRLRDENELQLMLN